MDRFGKKECKHENRQYLKEVFVAGHAVEACVDCGMSRTHWEQGESAWVAIGDIPESMGELREAVERLVGK